MNHIMRRRLPGFKRNTPGVQIPDTPPAAAEVINNIHLFDECDLATKESTVLHYLLYCTDYKEYKMDLIDWIMNSKKEACKTLVYDTVAHMIIAIPCQIPLDEQVIADGEAKITRELFKLMKEYQDPPKECNTKKAPVGSQARRA